MDFKYSPIKRLFIRVYRIFFPISNSPWAKGNVKDVCSINLIPPSNLKSFFVKNIKNLQSIKGNEIGDYLEFGVFNGSSMSTMYFAAKEMNLKSMKFFGFDAFQGLPLEAEKEDGGVWKKGFYACSFEKMLECLKRKKIDPKNINWIKGWYKDTLNNKTRDKYKFKKIGIVFIDCDTYSSSKIVLDFIKPLIIEPMILCFDDWKLNNLDILEMGEYKSFNEFLEKNTNLVAKEIKSYNRKSKSFIIKPTSI